MARRRSASVSSISPATRRTWLVGVVIAVGTCLYTTGPLYRIRTWWSFDDPLAADWFVIGVQILTGVVAVAALVRGDRWRRVDRRIGIVAVGLVSWLAVGSLWSASASTTLRESLLVGVGLLAGAAAAAVSTERLLIGAAWVGVHIGLGWSAALVALVRPGSQDANGEWTGVYFNPNSLALVTAFGMLLAVVLLAMLSDRRTPMIADTRLRIAAAGVVGASIVADLWLISGTGSLTPLFGLVVAAAVAVVALVARRFVGPSGRRPLDARVVSGVTGLVLVVLGLVAWWTRGSWLSSVGRTSELTGRTAMWDVALEWFRQRPIVGQGYLGAWYDPDFAAAMLAARGEVLGSTHNTFIELLLGGGLVGFGLAFAMCALLWIASGARALTSLGSLAAWPLGALVYVVFQNLAETLLVSAQLMVVVIGALAVVSASYEATEPAAAVDVVDLDVIGVERRG